MNKLFKTWKWKEKQQKIQTEEIMEMEYLAK